MLMQNKKALVGLYFRISKQEIVNLHLYEENVYTPTRNLDKIFSKTFLGKANLNLDME